MARIIKNNIEYSNTSALPVEDISSQLILASGFVKESWGYLTGVKYGKIVIIAFAGVHSTSNISSATTMVTLPTSASVNGASVLVDDSGNAILITVTGTLLEVFKVDANKNLTGQIVLIM